MSGRGWTTSTHGYDPEDWDRAKAEMRTALIEAAGGPGTISYSDLADRVTAISNPKKRGWHYALNLLLGQISIEEHQRGAPLLSAVAVYKEEMAPGPGFDSVVRELGLGDPLEVWVRELKRSQQVYASGDRSRVSHDAPRAPDARSLLEGLVGETLDTRSGAPNTVVEVSDTSVLVATEKSPDGSRVPIREVQAALDMLYTEGSLNIDVDVVGYRSAFIEAVLRTLPGARAASYPRRIYLEDAGTPK